MHRAAERLLDGPRTNNLPWELDKNKALGDLMASMRGLKYSLTEQPLFLFWRWRLRDATDPQDKIYVLMGIQENLSLQSERSCDYTVNAVTLYSRVTADLIRTVGDLEPIIGRRGEEPAIEGLPSWAINWSCAWSGNCYWLHQARWRQRGYTADRGIYGVGDGLRITDDDRTLILSGVFVDKIAAVDLFDCDLSGASTPARLISGGEKWGELFEAFLRLQSPHQSDDHGDPMDDWVYEILGSQAISITESGRVGVGQVRVQPGSELWILG